MANELRNVKVEFTTYAESQLEGTAAVCFEGEAFDVSEYDEWFEVYDLGHTPVPTNADKRHEHWLFQISCYARTGPGGKSIHRVWELADAVRAAFERVNLSVKDWSVAGGGSEVGKLQFTYVNIKPVPPGPRSAAGASSVGVASRELQHIAVTIPAVYLD